MAAQDMNAIVRVKDKNGNVNNIYPATKIGYVEGLQTALNSKANASDVTSGLAGKVDKETGKVLSTNDYTTAEKNKLAGIAAGATANIGTVTQVKVGSTAYNPSSGVVSLPSYPTTLPASDVSSWAKASSKPSYTASEVGAIATTAKGAASGVAELDANGKVPSSQLPAYVDDVLEYTAKSSFPTTGETGKIYVDTTTNLTYRWSGSAYVEISPSLALGTTSSTAYRGDRGNTAYSHATDSSRLTTAQSSGLYKIATTAQGHIASVTAVAKSDITGLGIPGSDTNTHRPIQVNGTQVLGDNTTALNLKAGSNVSLSNSSGTVTIAATDTTYSAATQSANGLMSSTDKTKLDGIATGATANIGTVTQVKVGSTAYNPSSGVVSLPAYPTSLPASDVSSWAKASSKPTYTASEVGLGNVGNFKAVSTVASQGLSSTEQSNARANIGAGTSSFSGSYNDLSNKPTIPTKTSQLTNDSGYTTNTGTVTGVKVGSTSYSPSSGIVSLPAYPTSLPASDVYSWAKQSSKPSYTASEVGLGNVGNFKAVSTVASQGLSSTEKSNARSNIGAAPTVFTMNDDNLTFGALLSYAVQSYGFDNETGNHCGLCTVTNGVDNEYLLFYWQYSYGSYINCISIANNNIALRLYNNLGTVIIMATEGKTYTACVQVFK